MRAGIYEFWVAEDGSESSLFPVAVTTPEVYYLFTHQLGDEEAGEEDVPMNRIFRLWLPGMWAAKAIRWVIDKKAGRR